MFQSPSILAVIPYYRRKDQLDKCLSALSHSTIPVEPFVHDNSNDNLGYTKASNIGLRLALQKRCTYAFLLNQDCYVRPDCIAQLVRFMEAHSDCAISGPRQMSSDNPDLILHGGGGPAFPQGKNISGYKSRGDCPVSRRMPWVNGAAMFARVDAIVEFGLMDANMFLIGSDSDWCFSARARGWSVWYCAEAECVHEAGICSVEPSVQTMGQFRTDMTYWRGKWAGSQLYARLRDEQL